MNVLPQVLYSLASGEVPLLHNPSPAPESRILRLLSLKMRVLMIVKLCLELTSCLMFNVANLSKKLSSMLRTLKKNSSQDEDY